MLTALLPARAPGLCHPESVQAIPVEAAPGTGPGWQKPRRSVGNGACAEVKSGPGVIGVRDSKLGEASPVLEFGSEEWERFTAGLKAS